MHGATVKIISRQVLEKSSNIEFHENPSSGSRVVLCGRTVTRTDRLGEGNSRFSQLSKRAYKPKTDFPLAVIVCLVC